MRRRGRREGLEGRRPGRAVVGRVRVRVGVAVRGRMRVSRVRRRWAVGIEVRIILIHHIGAAHHPARARHPRAGLQARVAERRSTPANDTPSTRRLPISSRCSSNDPRAFGAAGTAGPALRTIRMERQPHGEFRCAIRFLRKLSRFRVSPSPRSRQGRLRGVLRSNSRDRERRIAAEPINDQVHSHVIPATFIARDRVRAHYSASLVLGDH